VLVGGEAARDVDPVEQPLTGGDPSERGCRRVAVGVDPEGRPVVQQQVIEHERLEHRDAAAALHVEEREAVVERREQHLRRGGISAVGEAPVAISAPRRLRYRQSPISTSSGRAYSTRCPRSR
jgi:hypothetical protein